MDKPILQLTREAKELHTVALKEITQISTRSYKLAQVLRELKRKNLYKYVFGDTCWRDYVKNLPNMSLSTADRLIERFELYHQKLGFTIDYLSQLNIRALNYILPLVKANIENRPLIEEWLEKVRNNTVEDIEREYTQVMKNINPRKCEHSFKYKVWCNICKEDFTPDFTIVKK